MCAGQTAGTRHHPGRGRVKGVRAREVRDHASPPPARELQNTGVSPEAGDRPGLIHNVKIPRALPTDQSQTDMRRVTDDKNQPDTPMGGPQRKRAAERAQRLLGTHRTPPYRASKEPKETGFSVVSPPPRPTPAPTPRDCRLLPQRTEDGERLAVLLSTATFSRWAGVKGGGGGMSGSGRRGVRWTRRTCAPEPDRGRPSLLLRAPAKTRPWRQSINAQAWNKAGPLAHRPVVQTHISEAPEVAHASLTCLTCGL